MAYYNAIMKWIKENLLLGDLGVRFLGEVQIGSKDNPKELCVGEGDSFVKGMVVFTSPDDSTFTDRTEEASSGSGSTYVAWSGGTSTGATDYVGSDYPFCGIKLITAIVANPGAGSIAREYWNGTAWVTYKAMASNALFPYDQRADDIGTVVGSEQVRFGGCGDQAKTTINGEEKYYIRFRITSDITSPPTIEQIKLHSNRFEVNPDGVTEYFGNGVYEKDLTMHWDLTKQLFGFSPANKNITFADGLELVYFDNQFNNGVTDGRGGYLVMPKGIDTSKGISVEFLWIPLADTAGDVVYQIETRQTNVGDVLDDSTIPDSVNGTVPIAIDSENKMQRTVIPLDVENLTPGEVLAFGFKRLGGDGLDTFVGNVALLSIRMVGNFWTP